MDWGEIMKKGGVDIVKIYGGLDKAKIVLKYLGKGASKSVLKADLYLRLKEQIFYLECGLSYDGTPFSCLEADVRVIEQVDLRKEFEPFFTKQPFFKSLKYQHGDRLFDFDQGIGYRNLTVQVGYVCFCKQDREFVLND